MTKSSDREVLSRIASERERTFDAHPGQPCFGSKGATRDDTAEGEPLAWCLACSQPMQDHSCKRRCPHCGYFEDCSNLI